MVVFRKASYLGWS